MLAYCTYCSAEKLHSEKELPAIDLYKSKRISDVYNSAKRDGQQFLILSGKYGIVDANQPIAYYDHLLTAEEVEEHTELVAEQLSAIRISEVVFFMSSLKHDALVKPYLDSISRACEKLEVSLVCKEGDYQD